MVGKKLFHKIFNICNLYILLWLLYNFHWNNVGTLFPVLDRLSGVFLGVNLVISGYCTIIVLAKYPKRDFFTILNVLILLFVIYGLFSIVQGPYVYKANTGTYIKSGTYMIAALRSFLPIYTFFLFCKLGYITENIIKAWFWIFLAQTLLIYMSYRIVLGLEEEDEMITNNRGYLFVYLFPFIYFFRKKPLIQYVLAAVFLYFTIYSLKRGAILITCLASAYLFWHQMTNVSNSKKIGAILVFLFLVYLGSGVVERMYENSIVFQHRFENTLEGGTSGRTVIAKNLLDIYTRSDMFHVLFGFGADGTLQFGNYAHNDWLEILFDQGILGLVVFGFFWWILFRIWRNQVQKKTELSILLGFVFVCNFPMTLFSMWYSIANIFITLPLAFSLSGIYKNGKVIRKS